MKKFILEQIQKLAPETLFVPTVEQIKTQCTAIKSVDIANFKEFILPYFCKTANNHKVFLNYVTQLAENIPIINTKGTAVSDRIRLLISSHLALMLWNRNKLIPSSINAIIIDPDNVFLTRHNQTVGMATTNSIKDYCQVITTIFHGLDQTFYGLSINAKTRTSHFSFKKEWKKVTRLVEKNTLSDFYKEELLVSLITARQTLTMLIQQIPECYNPEERTAINEKLPSVNESLQTAFIKMEASLKTTNGMFLYISWPFFLNNQYFGGNENVIFHEMAHFIDFNNEELNGIPLQLLIDNHKKEWEVRWSKQFERAKEGAFHFLNSYAQKNPLEFFAVCSALYFSDNETLKQGDFQLYELLYETYGAIAVTFKMPIPSRMKSWHFYKQLKRDRKAILN